MISTPYPAPERRPQAEAAHRWPRRGRGIPAEAPGRSGRSAVPAGTSAKSPEIAVRLGAAAPGSHPRRLAAP